VLEGLCAFVVVQHRIGNWVKILDDPEFTWHPTRTNVDLKDR